MKRTLVMVGTTLAVLAGAFCLMPGCEDDADTGGDALDDYFKNHPYVSDPRGSTDSEVIITPGQATITAVGEEALFTAKGGDGNYTWDVVDNAAGHLETVLNGANISQSQRRYKADQLKQNNVVVYDRNGEAAIADILYTTDALNITPDDVEIGAVLGIQVDFTVSGGVPPYTWSMAFPQMEDDGVITPDPGNANVGRYTSAAMVGTNVVTVMDSVGDTATATVKQQ